MEILTTYPDCSLKEINIGDINYKIQTYMSKTIITKYKGNNIISVTISDDQKILIKK